MPQYTIRVYGLWINEREEILLSDERLGDVEFSKFPGGGMEKGEGILDCLRREWHEELQTSIEVLSHFYTTDFFQASAFHKDKQLISVYYLVRPSSEVPVPITQHKVAFQYDKHQEVYFRWVPLSSLQEEMLSFPIDQYVVRLIKKRLA